MMNVPLSYQIIDNPASLSALDQLLLDSARKALEFSYSPYSNFKVGAAIQLTSGTIVTGFNIENASYPVCLCAEQTTISAVKTQYPNQVMQSMAITVRNPHQPVHCPATPCGQCRQMLSEQEHINGSPIRLLLQGETGPIWLFESVSYLLPLGFSGSLL